MKKCISVLGLITLLWAAPVLAGPFLVCDPYTAADGITSFNLTIDSGSPTSIVPVNMALHYDLSGLANGAHTVTAQACNLWGCSTSSSPLAFTKSVPASPPMNIKISAQ